MSSESKDAYETSLIATSEIRLQAKKPKHWSQKAREKGVWQYSVDQKSTPNKPGVKHHSNGSINGHSERLNLLFALSKVDN